MVSIRISQAEVERLLDMIKRSMVSRIDFPQKGEEINFKVSGDRKQDVFTISIFRGKINPLKYNVGARILKNNIMLLELHVNPSNIHINPNGEKITGSHWHIYNEQYGRLWAFNAESINSESFVENTIAFLNRFNVIEQPTIDFQLELI